MKKNDNSQELKIEKYPLSNTNFSQVNTDDNIVQYAGQYVHRVVVKKTYLCSKIVNVMVEAESVTVQPGIQQYVTKKMSRYSIFKLKNNNFLFFICI